MTPSSGGSPSPCADGKSAVVSFSNSCIVLREVMQADGQPPCSMRCSPFGALAGIARHGGIENGDIPFHWLVEKSSASPRRVAFQFPRSASLGGATAQTRRPSGSHALSERNSPTLCRKTSASLSTRTWIPQFASPSKNPLPVLAKNCRTYLSSLHRAVVPHDRPEKPTAPRPPSGGRRATPRFRSDSFAPRRPQARDYSPARNCGASVAATRRDACNGLVQFDPAAKCLKIRLLSQADLMDHLAAEIGKLHRIEPSTQTRFDDGNRPLPRREVELKGAVHRAATTSARHKIHLRILGDTAEHGVRISADRKHLAEGGNLGEQGVPPASPEPDCRTSVRDADILAQHRSDERIPCE